MATISALGKFYNPATSIAKAIRDSLDPSKTPSKVKTLSTMTDEERQAIEKRYNAKIGGN